MTYISKGIVQFGDSASIDPFGRARVSTPYTLFDSKQIYDNNPLVWDDVQVSGAGTTSTFNTNQSSTTIAVSNATAGIRVRQSKRKFNYQPGKGHLILVTFTVGATPSGVTKRVGYFDEDGIFLQRNGSTTAICMRTFVTGSAVTTEINQSSWNLDRMDGTGVSGITLDITKSQILMVDMEWLGVGRVRCAFVINGIPHYFHEFIHANLNSGVYINDPNQSIRYEIINNGTGTASGLECICSSVMSEGGVQENGMLFATDRGSSVFAAGNDTNIYPLLGIRLNTSKLSATARLHSFSLVCTTTSQFRWAILLNPTITGTALTYSAVTNSVVDAMNTSTNATTISGGTLIFSGYSNQATSGDLNIIIPVPIYLGSTVGGVADQILLGVQRVTGTSESYVGSLNWIEG